MIVGNASGLRCLTVFVPSNSAFRSRSKHSGVKCSEQTRLCLGTGGSFKQNLTSRCFKRSGFLSGRVKKLTPYLISMSLLQQPNSIQCIISCTCAEVTPPILHVKRNELMTSSFKMATHYTITPPTLLLLAIRRVNDVNHSHWYLSSEPYI